MRECNYNGGQINYFWGLYSAHGTFLDTSSLKNWGCFGFWSNVVQLSKLSIHEDSNTKFKFLQNWFHCSCSPQETLAIQSHRHADASLLKDSWALQGTTIPKFPCFRSMTMKSVLNLQCRHIQKDETSAVQLENFTLRSQNR